MDFSREQLERYRGVAVPDLVVPGVRLLFVDITPGLWSAAVGAHFAHPANRFWPALRAARIVDRLICVSAGMSEEDKRYVTDRQLGITSLVPTAIGDACEVSARQLRAGRKRLVATVEQTHPEVVAICGAVGFGLAYGQKEWVVPGRQDRRIADAQLWVLPNPSGSNPHASIRDLATAFRSAALAAGVVS